MHGWMAPHGSPPSSKVSLTLTLTLTPTLTLTLFSGHPYENYVEIENYYVKSLLGWNGAEGIFVFHDFNPNPNPNLNPNPDPNPNPN